MMTVRTEMRIDSEATAKPQGCTNLKLRQLTRRISQHYDGYLGRTGLKTTQYSLLSAVLRLGPITPGELARIMEMDASTLSRNLRPLIAQGWLELGPGEDARTRSVQVTHAGRDKRAEAQREWRAAQEALNRTLGPAVVVQLHALIDASLARLHESSGV